MGVKVPKITLHAESGEGQSFGEVNMASVGYGLHQTWVYACMFSATLFPASSVPIDVAGSHGSISIMYVISIITFGAVLLACGLFDQRVLKAVVTKKFAVLAAAICCVGTVVAIVPGSVFGPSVAVDVCAGVLTGVGSAFLIIEWGVAFARCEGTTILLNTAVAMVVAMAGYALLLHHVPMWVAAAIVCALPAIEALILLKETPDPYYERGEAPIFMPIPAKRHKFVFAFGVPVALLGFSLGMMRQVSAQLIMPAVSGEMQFACIAAAALAALVLAVTGIALSEDYSWSVYFRVCMPVIAFGAFFMPFSLAAIGQVPTVITLCGYLMFEMLLWSFFGEVSQRFNLSPVMVFGVGRGLAALTSLAGSCMLLFEGQLLDAYGIDKAMAAFAVLVIAVLGYSLVPSERKMAHVVVPCPLVVAAGDGLFDSSVYNDAFFEREAKAAQAQVADQPQKGGGKRWFKKNCEAVSARYLLSRRETEVLFYLAKGYNSAAIQEKLYISEGTAKTHIRHIYRKLDIHTQQELMRMVEKGE